MLNQNRLTVVAILLCLFCLSFAQAQELPNPDPTALPPRSVPESLPARPVPDWVRTHFRVGHLPGSLAMSEAFVNAGYNVVTLNTLGRWDIVGPSASLYPAERVKEAEGYMRTHVERCHRAGAKAIFYIGPVQVPVGQSRVCQGPSRLAAHPPRRQARRGSQLRQYPQRLCRVAAGATGVRDANIQGRRLLVRRLRAAASAHVRRGDQESLPRIFRRQGDSASTRLRPRRPHVL